MAEEKEKAPAPKRTAPAKKASPAKRAAPRKKAAPEPEAKTGYRGPTKVVFINPVEFEGTTYSELDLDFDSMTGRDMAEIKREWAARGNQVSMSINLDPEYQGLVTCFAAGMPSEFLDNLPAQDWALMGVIGQAFLLNWSG